MTNNSYARTAAGMFDTINRRLVSVERRLPPVPYVPPPTGGTSSARDAYYGVPSTDAQRVTLANQRVQWFNTDLGWNESYYAVTGLTGLTAKGLVAGTTSGWYPTGRGPVLSNYPGVNVQAFPGNSIQGWDTTSWSRGGTSWIEYNSGAVQVKKAGRYRVFWRTAVQAGGGALDMHLYAGGTFTNDAWELFTTLYNTHHFEYANIALTANDTCYAYDNAGECTIHIGSSTRRGEFTVEYLGPSLVSD